MSGTDAVVTMGEKGILITGMGTISAAGRNLSESLTSMASGQRKASRVSLFDTPLDDPVFEVPDLPGEYYLEGQRTLSLALCAVDEALKDAQLKAPVSGLRVGVCMGTVVASQLSDIDFYGKWRNTGSAPMLPADRFLGGNLGNFIARKIGAKPLSLTVVNACSAGSDSIGVAASWIKGGLCDIAIAGGADEMNRIPLCGFKSMGNVSSKACAPFDRDRQGLNLGEGAGVMVLETEASALSRGVSSNLRLLGYGSSCDAYHLTAPRPDGAGLRRAMKRALMEAGLEPHDISFINAHGTATTENDRVEGKALLDIFGAGLKMLSTKGFTGHTLGAAGGIEAVFTVAGLREGWIPGNAGFKASDDEIGVAPVPEKTSIHGPYALSVSLAFGGNNTVLVFGRED